MTEKICADMQNRTFQRNSNGDINKCWENLANAVIIQAIKDYKSLRKKIDKDKASPYDIKRFNEVLDFFYDEDSAITLFTSLPARELLKEGDILSEQENQENS